METEFVGDILELATDTEVMLTSSSDSSSSVSTFQIQVKTVSGKTITINDVENTSTILWVMQRIQDKDGLPVSEQRLAYPGKELQKAKTVADYSITKDATLFSLMRLRGGLGERATMEYTIGKEIKRGNLKNEITASAGASIAIARAWPNFKAPAGSRLTKVFSTAATTGRYSARTALSP